MNMQALMKQAQTLQRDMMKAKEDIDASVFDGESALVKIKLNGKKELLSVEIQKDTDISKEDIEMLEDMLLLSINSAMKKVDKMTEEKMGKFGNGMPGLF